MRGGLPTKVQMGGKRACGRTIAARRVNKFDKKGNELGAPGGEKEGRKQTKG